MKKKIIAALCLSLLLIPAAGAHPGRTDASGGHWDNSTGEYHYHHGYPAHQHENGICPYDPNYSTAAQSEAGTQSAAEPADSAADVMYNDGLGDDGFPVDVVHAGRLGHGAEEHDVHAFGIAELLGDLARLEHMAAKMLLHGLETPGRSRRWPCRGQETAGRGK